MTEPDDPNVTADFRTDPGPVAEANSLSTIEHTSGSATTGDARQGDDELASGLPVVPGYRVLREIARGGMGRVLVANEIGLEREVAIKVLLNRTNGARFVRESTITARLPHPGVPPVYALGRLADGSPFLAMKLVDGRTLADAMKTTDLQRLMQVYTQVCQAVGFAHSRGVIHRDLKPANVMVGAFGEVQVMDWGLAKDLTGQKIEEPQQPSDSRTVPAIDAATDQSTDLRSPGESTDDQTYTGQVMGTPAFMAPEQARGESTDARGDVFALGGILCALLTGHPPYRGKTSVEVLKLAASVQLADANARLDTCGADGELVTLCRRCLSPNPADRPANGQEVADGVSAYLNGVQERLQAAERERAVAVAKAAEERRRRRVQVIAASLVLMVLSAGIAGTTFGLLDARTQRDLANERYDQLSEANAKTETERDRADKNFVTARAMVLDMGQRINQIETGVTDPKLADLARKQALDKAREQFEKFLVDRPDDVEVQRQAAYLHRYAANVARALSDFRSAAIAYTAAIKIYEDLANRFPDLPVYQDDLAQTLSDRASAEKRMGSLKDASVTLDRALKLTEWISGKFRDSMAFRRSLAVILNDRTDVVYRLGQFDEAAQLAGRASELFDQLKTAPVTQRNPIDPLYAAMAVHRLALARRELGKTAEALTAHEDATARMKALNGPKANRDVRYWDCEVRRELARTASTVPARRQAAANDLAEVIGVMEKLVAENPQLAFYHEGLAAAYLRRGELLLQLEEPGPATAALGKSMLVSRELLNRFGPLSGSVLVRGQSYLALGRARAAVGKKDEAAANWKTAVGVFEAGLKVDPDNVHHKRGLAEAKQLLGAPAK
jgi:tetratricopeptide (TPR) repeat protein